MHWNCGCAIPMSTTGGSPRSGRSPASRFTVSGNLPAESCYALESQASAGCTVPYKSVSQMRFTVDENTTGWLQLKSLRPRWFTKAQVQFHHGLPEALALAIANQRAQWALRERVKELTYLYGISRIAQPPGTAIDDVLAAARGIAACRLAVSRDCQRPHPARWTSVHHCQIFMKDLIVSLPNSQLGVYCAARTERPDERGTRYSRAREMGGRWLPL